MKKLEGTYSAVVDIDKEISERRERSNAEVAAAADRLSAIHAQVEKEQAEHDALARRLEEGQQALALVEEHLEDISFGVYAPHFAFDTPDEYKQAIEQTRNRQRDMIRGGKAALCAVQWRVGDSAKDGARMTKQYTKLLLRAFNGECDAAVANVSWNNVVKMQERIKRSFDAINELGSTMQMKIDYEYLNLKLAELRLTYEFEQKKHEDRERQRQAREQLREEERALREIERAKDEAERDEARFAQALERARVEASLAHGAQLQRLTDQIATFEAKLDEARKKKERAISRAQLTKSGFVYVISNIGSFGEGVVKIGMTRRMEPMERIVELGDASVPFPFDLHALMFSDDAPELENALHSFLAERRVNRVNHRKEFYKGVALDEIEAFVRDRGLSAQFTKIPEAKEYRETLALFNSAGQEMRRAASA